MTLAQAGNISLILNLGHQGKGLMATRQDANGPTEYQRLHSGTSSGYYSATQITEVDGSLYKGAH